MKQQEMYDNYQEFSRNDNGELVKLSQLDRVAKPSIPEIVDEHFYEMLDDKTEPKFREGDWVVYKCDICKIVKREEGCNKLVTNFGIEKELVNERNLSTARLWTIEDAKDGDVLVASDYSIFLFKGTNDYGCIHYVALGTYGAIVFNEGLEHCWETSTAVHPATKEQRDLLIQKMKEAGYEWDVEKKELKKIEQTPCMIQKPCLIQWKGNNLKEVIDFTGKSKNFDKWFKSFEEYEKYVNDHNGIFKMFCEDGSHYEVPVGAWIVKTPDGYNVASKAIFIQKPAWSVEDEKEYRRVKYAIMKVFGGDAYLIGWIRKFKNILRPQTAWKPSDEQIRPLGYAIDYFKKKKNDTTYLESLYQDLKKLRDE